MARPPTFDMSPASRQDFLRRPSLSRSTLLRLPPLTRPRRLIFLWIRMLPLLFKPKLLKNMLPFNQAVNTRYSSFYMCRGQWALCILMVKECKAFYLDSLKNKENGITVCCHIFWMMLSSGIDSEVELCQEKVEHVIKCPA